ncbi:uncharacterized protein LOC144139872 [Haemaphysalis longicornis]
MDLCENLMNRLAVLGLESDDRKRVADFLCDLTIYKAASGASTEFVMARVLPVSLERSAGRWWRLLAPFASRADFVARLREKVLPPVYDYRIRQMSASTNQHEDGESKVHEGGDTPNKTKAMTFTRSTNIHLNSYSINNTVIENVSTLKYLGVYLSSNLTWNEHIDAIISKGSKTLGFIKRNLYLARQSTKLLAYTKLVQSKLEYASIIWNPNQAYLTDRLEALQNKAARFITKNYSRTSSITAIKESLLLPSLEKRRILALLSHFHRLYHSASSFAASHIKPAHRIFPRLDHPFKVLPLFARTNLLRTSPLFLAIFHWNRLPEDIATIHNHDLFVSRLKHFLCIDS